MGNNIVRKWQGYKLLPDSLNDNSNDNTFSTAEEEVGWSVVEPEDAFLHIFSFLSQNSLLLISSVNHLWKKCLEAPCLWETLDLSRIHYMVDDQFLSRVLDAPRYSKLQVLILQNCIALTNEALVLIQNKAPLLQKLILTGVYTLDQRYIESLVHALPLTHLELYKAINDFQFASRLKEINPNIGLGLFWLEYCAASGLLDSGITAVCRHENSFNGRGCWGQIEGRLIYDNIKLLLPGNYPTEVLYSCQNHSDDDHKDEDLYLCQLCDCLFRLPSMWTDFVCRLCFDTTNLQNKNTWVPLTKTNISEFGYSDVISKTLHIADRKNLPLSLRSYGTLPCQIDYTIPDGERDSRQHLVSMNSFLENNRWRIDGQITTIQDLLSNAVENKCTRALLCFDANNSVEVLCDKNLILDGKKGVEQMELVQRAWHQALSIIYPIAALLLAVIYFSGVVGLHSHHHHLFKRNTDIMIESSRHVLSPRVAMIVGGGIIIVVVVIVFLIIKYRDQCEHLLRGFMVVYILMIYVVGTGSLSSIIVQQTDMIIEFWSFLVVVWNFSFIGLWSLYHPVPPKLHRFYLLLFTSIMALSMVTALEKFVCFFFVSIVALADLLSELRVRFRLIPPFILPSGTQLIYETPRIWYDIGGLRLRTVDFMWYGVMIRTVQSTYICTISAFIALLSSICIVEFVLPFYGKRFRNLPIALLCITLLYLFGDSAMSIFIGAHNFLDKHDVTLSYWEANS